MNRHHLRRIPALTMIIMLMLALATSALSGCSMLPGGGEQTVSDPAGVFHFVVPEDWSVETGSGVMTVYAAKDAPSPDAAIGETPWMFVLSSTTPSEDKVPDRLLQLAKQRAELRGWKDIEFGKPAKTKLGKVEGYEIDVSATDEKKRQFEGKLLLARDGSSEALVFAFAKPGSFTGDEYEALKSNFYWHTGADLTTEKK